MITTIQCKAYVDECKVLGAAPKISIKRATAIMAVCRTWLEMSRVVGRYEALVKQESEAVNAKGRDNDPRPKMPAQ